MVGINLTSLREFVNVGCDLRIHITIAPSINHQIKNIFFGWIFGNNGLQRILHCIGSCGDLHLFVLSRFFKVNQTEIHHQFIGSQRIENGKYIFDLRHRSKIIGIRPSIHQMACQQKQYKANQCYFYF